MATKFEGGPAHGIVLTIRRAPLFLRVVQDKQGKWDALDQLSDTPSSSERISVYKLVENNGSVHFDGIKDGRRFGTWCVMARYLYYPCQPSEEVLRSKSAWPQWCLAEVAKTDSPGSQAGGGLKQD